MKASRACADNSALRGVVSSTPTRMPLVNRSLTIALLAAASFAPLATMKSQTATRSDSVIVFLSDAVRGPLLGANIQYRTSAALPPGSYDGATGTDELGRGAFPRPQSTSTMIRVRAIGYEPQVHVIRFDTVSGPLRIEMVLASYHLGYSVRSPLVPVGRIRLFPGEPRPDSGRTTRPIVLSLRSERQFGCLGAFIDLTVGRKIDRLKLTLHGIAEPPAVCATALGAAEANPVIEIEPGRYSLIVVAQPEGLTDSLWLEVTDSSYKLVAGRLSFITADERLRWRYPPNVFALTCMGDEARTRPVCDDFRRWLAARPGVTVHAFAPDGVNPFRPDRVDPDRRVWTFRAADARVLAAVLDCLGEVNDRIKEAVGVGLGIESWKGDRHSIFSTRTFDQPHIEIPQRVTGGARCDGG
jgi:hypothetical protein